MSAIKKHISQHRLRTIEKNGYQVLVTRVFYHLLIHFQRQWLSSAGGRSEEGRNRPPTRQYGRRKRPAWNWDIRGVLEKDYSLVNSQSWIEMHCHEAISHVGEGNLKMERIFGQTRAREAGKRRYSAFWPHRVLHGSYPYSLYGCGLQYALPHSLRVLDSFSPKTASKFAHGWNYWERSPRSLPSPIQLRWEWLWEGLRLFGKQIWLIVLPQFMILRSWLWYFDG